MLTHYIKLKCYTFSLINYIMEIMKQPLMGVCVYLGRWREETAHAKNNSFGGGRSCSFRICDCLFVGYEICHEEEE